jgi:hypothetical protein
MSTLNTKGKDVDRSAVAAPSLPFGVAVEVEAVVEVSPASNL